MFSERGNKHISLFNHEKNLGINNFFLIMELAQIIEIAKISLKINQNKKNNFCK